MLNSNTVGQPTRASVRYCFGTFELDRGTGELRKRGIRIRLQDQPYRILCLLLESPGEVISREKLCAALWPADTFVEFERSLNAAIAKLRQALGDSAENPRFIETVARRGYRFISPVEAVGLSEQRAVVGLQPAPIRPIETEDLSPAVSHHVQKLAKQKNEKKIWFVGAAIAAILVALGVAGTLVRRSGPSATPQMTRLTFDSGLTTDPATSPDGKLLAYASDRSGDGRLHIWVQQLIPDGQAVQLTRGDADDHQPNFSPDGSTIAFRSERDGGGVYVIPTIGGQVTLMAKGGRDPRFSPDGRWIAYWQADTMASPLVANAGTTYLIPTGGGTPRLIGSGLVEAGVPIWSEDGTRLLVYGHNDDVEPPDANWDWWVVQVNGGAVKPTGAFALLEKYNFSLGLNAPRAASWMNRDVLFFGRTGDSVNIWKIHLGDFSSRVEGDPQRLTSGIGLEAYPNLTADGRVLFAGLTYSSDVWMLPMDTNAARASGQLLRVTETIGPHRGASLSLDGRWLVYSSRRYGKSQTRIRNLETQTDTPVAGKAEGSVQLSRDGSLIVCHTGGNDRSSLVVPVGGGLSDQFCTDCDTPYDLSPDNKLVLYRKGAAIRAFDLVTRQDNLLMKRDGYQLYQTKFSPDSRWLTFEAVHQGRSRLYVAALRNSTTRVLESDWIPITSDESWADKPRWSPDSKSVYFVSNRDGFFCLWSQRLVHDSKQPIGEPVSVAHFHESRLSMANIGPGFVLELSVAKDKIAFNLGQLTGNIWATRLSR